MSLNDAGPTGFELGPVARRYEIEKRSNAAPADVGMPLLSQKNDDVEPSRVTRQYEIAEGSSGHTYAKIFAPCISDSLTRVRIEEPFLQERYHFEQISDFLKVFLVRATNLRTVNIVTKKATCDNEAEQTTRRARQERELTKIDSWLKSERVNFSWEYKDFHDRWIGLDNGWKVTIGRGLSFYHPSSGASDRDFATRRCRQTTALFVPV
ncbi:hypothetical protein AAVH_38606 [Aphelenchoides avenae]|nr:hypothetical protein AAVH_38606 [Aphelenchus avenae]